MSSGRECRPRLVLFDFDGTIIDTMGEYADAAAALIAEATGLPWREAREEYLRLSGRSFRDQLRLIGVPPDKIEWVARRFEEQKIMILEKHRPDRLVWDRIARLRRCGLKTAVSTNNECHIVARVDWLGELFDIVLCHDPATGKGKGLSHLKELEGLGYHPCSIVFVGDSDYDLDVYKPYGVKTVRTRGLWVPDDRAIDSILGEVGCRAEH